MTKPALQILESKNRLPHHRLRKRVITNVSADDVDPHTGKPYGTPVRQEFAKEADINHIIRTTTLNGGILPTHNAAPRYGDFASAPSYEESLNLVIKAQDHFDSLDARIRDRFHNDPQNLLKWLDDPRNAEEAVKLGIASKREPEPEPAPIKVTMVNSDAPKA